MKRNLPRLVRLVVLAAPLALAPPAQAVSVYDVILLSQNGFSEPEILRILDATESAFTISADDVVRLKRLGVGEPVAGETLVHVDPSHSQVSPKNTAPGPYPPNSTMTPRSAS